MQGGAELGDQFSVLMFISVHAFCRGNRLFDPVFLPLHCCVLSLPMFIVPNLYVSFCVCVLRFNWVHYG